MAMSLRRAVRPLTGALHSLAPAAGARTAGARRTLALARPTEDADSVQFPREGPGLDYALNWSLCGDGVVPSKLAYRITKVQAAEQLLGGPPTAPASSSPYCLRPSTTSVAHRGATASAFATSSARQALASSEKKSSS